MEYMYMSQFPQPQQKFATGRDSGTFVSLYGDSGSPLLYLENPGMEGEDFCFPDFLMD